MSFLYFKKQEEKTIDENFNQVLKWDFEKDIDDDKNISDNKQYTPIFDLTNNLLKSTGFQKKNSFGLYRQLTIESAKNKIIRSRTAATLKNKDSELIEVVDEKGNILKINKNILQRAKTELKNNLFFSKKNSEEDISDIFTFIDTDGISKRVTLKDPSCVKNDLNESTDMIDYKSLYYEDKNEDSLDNECLKNYEDPIDNNFEEVSIKKDLFKEKEKVLAMNPKYILCRFFKNKLYISRNYIRCILMDKELNFINKKEKEIFSNSITSNIDNTVDKKNGLTKLRSVLDEKLNPNGNLETDFSHDEFLPIKMKSGKYDFKPNINDSVEVNKNFDFENDLYLDEIIEKNQHILEIDLSPEEILFNIMKFNQNRTGLNYKKILKEPSKCTDSKEFVNVNDSLNVISGNQEQIVYSDIVDFDGSYDELVDRSFEGKFDFLIENMKPLILSPKSSFNKLNQSKMDYSKSVIKSKKINDPKNSSFQDSVNAAYNDQQLSKIKSTKNSCINRFPMYLQEERKIYELDTFNKEKDDKYIEIPKFENFFNSKYSSFRNSKDLFYDKDEFCNFSTKNTFKKLTLSTLNNFKEIEKPYLDKKYNKFGRIKPYYEILSSKETAEMTNTVNSIFHSLNDKNENVINSKNNKILPQNLLKEGKGKLSEINTDYRSRFSRMLSNIHKSDDSPSKKADESYNRSFSQTYNNTNQNWITKPNFYDINKNMFENFFDMKILQDDLLNKSGSSDINSRKKRFFPEKEPNNLYKSNSKEKTDQIEYCKLTNKEEDKKNSLNIFQNKKIIKHLTNSEYPNNQLSSKNYFKERNNMEETRDIQENGRNKDIENYNINSINRNSEKFFPNNQNATNTLENSYNHDFIKEKKSNSKKFLHKNINEIKLMEDRRKNPEPKTNDNKIKSDIKRKINFIINKETKSFCDEYRAKNFIFNDKAINHLESSKFLEKFKAFHKVFRHKGMQFNPVKHVINLDSIEKNFQTTEELILSTFNENDLKLIQTDVTYYIKDTNLIKNTEALKMKKMKDILLSEGEMHDKEIKNNTNNKIFKNKNSNLFMNNNKNKTFFDPISFRCRVDDNKSDNLYNESSLVKINKKGKDPSANNTSIQDVNEKIILQANSNENTKKRKGYGPYKNNDTFFKTNFYHLYETGTEKDHQRSDLIGNKYNELFYEVDKNLMKYHVKENIIDHQIDFINKKIQNEILLAPYSKNPKSIKCNLSNESLSTSQFHTYYKDKTKERNFIFDIKAVKIKEDYQKFAEERKFTNDIVNMIKTNFIKSKVNKKLCPKSSSISPL